MEPEALRAWLRLANVQLSPRLTRALLRHFQNDPQALFAATNGQLDAAVPELQARHLERLREPHFEANARQLAWMEQQPDRHLVWIDHPDYPRPLLEIPDPPAVLFVRGQLQERDRFAVGIVGSRQATPYGRAVAERLARELAAEGLTVVSGGAVGIDTTTHRGALAGGGRTFAVLGCGLDVDYPRDNRGMFEQIVGQGALLSEYPPGVQPESWHFPARNRIISGLSQGVLVVEAPQTSGALITARYAAEHGRPVMAVPGNIDRPSSFGTNELLKEGAIMVTETADILRALGMVVLPARPEHQRTFDLTSEEAANESAAPKPLSPSAAETRPRSVGALAPTQAKLLETLSLNPRHIDAIAQEAGLSASQVGVEMTLMEINGLVRRLPGNTYIRIL